MIDQAKILEIIDQAGLDIKPSEEDFHKPFSEIGLDSLDVFELLSEIDVALGKSFSDEEFGQLKTIDDVISMLNKS